MSPLELVLANSVIWVLVALLGGLYLYAQRKGVLFSPGKPFIFLKQLEPIAPVGTSRLFWMIASWLLVTAFVNILPLALPWLNAAHWHLAFGSQWLNLPLSLAKSQHPFLFRLDSARRPYSHRPLARHAC